MHCQSIVWPDKSTYSLLYSLKKIKYVIVFSYFFRSDYSSTRIVWHYFPNVVFIPLLNLDFFFRYCIFLPIFEAKLYIKLYHYCPIILLWDSPLLSLPLSSFLLLPSSLLYPVYHFYYKLFFLFTLILLETHVLSLLLRISPTC